MPPTLLAIAARVIAIGFQEFYRFTVTVSSQLVRALPL
jgi:hypothetical protein